MPTRQMFDTVDVLRLEVEDDPVGLVNLIPNPSGDLGAWGWGTPVAGSNLTVLANPTRFRYTGNGAAGDAEYLRSQPLPVTELHYVKARFAVLGGSPVDTLRVRFEWRDAAEAILSTSPVSAYVEINPGVDFTMTYGGHQAPAGTHFVTLRVDLYNDGTGANPGASNTFEFNEVAVAAAATAGELTDLDYTDPVTYVNILDDVREIEVAKEALNTGHLIADIVSAALDPLASDVVRPGRRCRLLAWDTTAEVWEPLFTGEIADAEVTYHYKDPRIPESKRARVTLSAYDATATLANYRRSQGVGTIADLPFVLEGCRVPWDVDTTGGNQVPTAAVVAVSENATALDQVAMVRDLAGARLAFVDRLGILRVSAAEDYHDFVTLTRDKYHDLDLGFGTADLVNEVGVKLRHIDPATGETIETTYGPYRDNASIREWGRRAAVYTVQGLDPEPNTVAAYADGILAANSQPRVRVRSLTATIDEPSKAWGVARAEPGTGVYVERADGAPGVFYDDTDPDLVTRVKHTIRPHLWTVDLAFADPATVAAPTAVPAIPGADPATVTSALGERVAYTPVWSSSGTAPALGNGSLTGHYARLGDLVAFTLTLTVGSTTTFGTGTWALTLPVDASSLHQGFPGTLVRPAPFASYRVHGRNHAPGAIRVECDPAAAGGAARNVTGTVPIALAAGDVLTISGAYPAA